MSKNLADDSFDKENAFLLYSIFCGDVKRTAHAINVKEDLIAKLAQENNWDQQLKPIIDLKQSARAGDVERALNRAINFVQAHQTRMMLQRVLKQLTGMSEKDLEAFLFPRETKGSTGEVTQKFSTRALADLASAIEKCHVLTYLALNDTSSDRKERGEDVEAGGESASEIHMKLAAAMSAAGGPSKSIKGLVLDAQLEIAQERAAVDVQAQARTEVALPQVVVTPTIGRNPA